eukprot:g7944.t1
MKRVTYQQGVRHKRRQRRPRSAGPYRNRRRRRSGSESNLHSNNVHVNNGEILPPWAVNSKHFNSNEPMALQHRHGGPIRRPLSKKERQMLENGWDDKFAQNAENNKYILSYKNNNKKKHTIVKKDYKNVVTATSNNTNKGQEQMEKRVEFSPTSSRKRLRRPRSAGQLRRYRSNRMDTLATKAERRKIKRKKKISKYAVKQLQLENTVVPPYEQQNVTSLQHEHGFGLYHSDNNITGEYDDLLYYSNATPTIQLPEDTIFLKNCNTIRSLWNELHIPNRDRRYFSRTFMLTFTEHNNNFVNEQLKLLLAHREKTIRTLIAIRERESAIKDLDSICKAAASALIRSNAIITTKKRLKGASTNLKNTKLLNNTSLSSAPKARPPVIDLTTSIKIRNEAINNSDNTINDNEKSLSKDVLQSLQIKSFRKLIIDRSRHAQSKTIKVINAIKLWRSNLWRSQPFRWRHNNYILRIGNCIGLKDIVNKDEIAEALKLCSINNNDFILLLPPHIRKTLFVADEETVTTNIEENANDEETDEIEEKKATMTGNVNDESRINIKKLLAAEEYTRNEQQLQIELRTELNDLLQAGYYIPTLKWNPNKLTFHAENESKDQIH